MAENDTPTVTSLAGARYECSLKIANTLFPRNCFGAFRHSLACQLCTVGNVLSGPFYLLAKLHHKAEIFVPRESEL
jgi:hypothetical protein